MLKLSRISRDRLLIGTCLVIIFIVCPLATLFWHEHPQLTDQVGQVEKSVVPVADNQLPALPYNSVPAPLAAGTLATSFSSTTIDGKKFMFDSRSPHLKIVDFWATWCGPCRMSIPGLEDLNTSMRNSGVQVVGVSVDVDTANQVKQFAKVMGMNYTVLVDPVQNPLAASTYNADGLPSLYIIDGKGIVRWSFSGYWPGEEQYIRQVISRIQNGQPVD